MLASPLAADHSTPTPAPSPLAKQRTEFRTMNKLFAPVVAVASTLILSMHAWAGPTTAPSALLDSVRSGQWSEIPQKLRLQYASTAVEPDQARVMNWINEYRTRHDRFAAERRKSYDVAVRDTHILADGGYVDLAMDGLADCYTLSSDKKAFVAEPWVGKLRDAALENAKKAAAAGEWLKARRIYGDLSVLEPTESKWTKAMDDMVRRVRVLGKYAPESFAGTLTREIEYRKAAKKFLAAATQPATQPTSAKQEEKTENEDQIAQNLHSEWKQDVAGIRIGMLREALSDARQSYYKDVDFAKTLAGGLSAMRIFATTPGLEKAFDKLGDEAVRGAFLEVVDAQIAALGDRPADRQVLEGVLSRLLAANTMTINVPEEVIVSEFADGAFATLDQFSSMIWPSELEEFRTSTQGEFSGVGVQIQDVDGQIKIVTPIEDSPALKAGIRAGDVISQINGKSAKGITTMQAKRLITGPSGTSVMLTVRSPDEKVKDYTLIRQTIKVASIKGWRHVPGGGWDYMLDGDQKIAYLRLTNFTKESSRELSSALETVEDAGARAVILDLRSNPGGLLTAATEVADKFLSGGKIVSTKSLRDETAESRIDAHETADDVKLPMAVLVNPYSASASEIVSGALRDQKRATIVGERTFGKGSVQMLFPLDKQQAFLKLTTSHYYLPNGKCIHREENAAEWGVDPDLTVEITNEQARKMLDARTELDILRDGNAKPDAQQKVAADLIDSDLQLNAALFVLRLQLAGSPAM
jgi:carboxyl-terminal processing protease